MNSTFGYRAVLTIGTSAVRRCSSVRTFADSNSCLIESLATRSAGTLQNCFMLVCTLESTLNNTSSSWKLVHSLDTAMNKGYTISVGTADFECTTSLREVIPVSNRVCASSTLVLAVSRSVRRTCRNASFCLVLTRLSLMLVYSLLLKCCPLSSLRSSAQAVSL